MSSQLPHRCVRTVMLYSNPITLIGVYYCGTGALAHCRWAARLLSYSDGWRVARFLIYCGICRIFGLELEWVPTTDEMSEKARQGMVPPYYAGSGYQSAAKFIATPFMQ